MSRFRSFALAAVAVATVAVALVQAPPARAARTYTVGMRDFGFKPILVVIEPGDTVRWVNDDPSGTEHDVRAYDGSFASSSNCPPANRLVDPGDCMKQGETFENTFDEVGNYVINYYCSLHSSGSGDPAKGECGMCGTVKVSVGSTRRSTPSPTRTRSTEPSPTATATATATGTATATATATAEATATGDATAVPTETTNGEPIAAPDEDGGGGRGGIAFLAILLLGGVGYAVYRRMIAPTA